MFDYPLFLPNNTYYHFLGLEPEASAEEIADARNELINDINKQKSNLEKQLEEIEAAVPDLKVARQKIHQPELTTAEKKEAKDKLDELEKQVRQNNPDYPELQERCQELTSEIHRINQLPLLNAEERLNYDRRTPPFELLKLERCTQQVLAHNQIILPLLREELSHFLVAQGEEVLHPSDFTRQDFSADFSYNPLLDGDE